MGVLVFAASGSSGSAPMPTDDEKREKRRLQQLHRRQRDRDQPVNSSTATSEVQAALPAAASQPSVPSANGSPVLRSPFAWRAACDACGTGISIRQFYHCMDCAVEEGFDLCPD